MRRVVTLGQQEFFKGLAAPARPLACIVIHRGRREPATANLPLAVARARAATLEGYRTVIFAADGTCAEVRREDDRFLVIPHGPAAWPDVVRRLLDERD